MKPIQITKIINGYKIKVGEMPKGWMAMFQEMPRDEAEFYFPDLDGVVIFLCRWFCAEQFMAEGLETPKTIEQREIAEEHLDSEIRSRYRAVINSGGFMEITNQKLPKKITGKVLVK